MCGVHKCGVGRGTKQVVVVHDYLLGGHRASCVLLIFVWRADGVMGTSECETTPFLISIRGIKGYKCAYLEVHVGSERGRCAPPRPTHARRQEGPGRAIMSPDSGKYYLYF